MVDSGDSGSSSVAFDDGYDSYYANRLWQLLPSIYRARDSDAVDVDGPLQELVERIGAQIAVVRRGIDRLWADQSIETCDDWVIPYIGDLLDVNLVDGISAAAQRQDVAKTIHYRRRKGTLAVLAELATDTTGWQAQVVEAFRTLSRTRHSLDPPVGPQPFTTALQAAGGAQAASLLGVEGLTGALTATPLGGLANLRSVHGAALAGSAFDEFAHTADMRAGQGATGHHDIGRLLVFLWRLQAFAVPASDPVAVAGCPAGTYVFDPTGRWAPLFMNPLQPPGDDFADTWTPALEWQVPGPLTDSLQRALSAAGPPYPNAGDVHSFFSVAVGGDAVPSNGVSVTPEVGEFVLTSAPSASQPPVVTYNYGFPAMLGAGTYDRGQLADPPAAIGVPAVVQGVDALGDALSAAADTGTVQIVDSRTYVTVPDVGSTSAPITSLLIQAGDQQRPVIRLAPPAAGDVPAAWVLTGGGDQALADEGLPELTLDGLLFSGGDIVLRGAFASVRLTGFTADPGSADAAQADGFALAADGAALRPTRLWIEPDPDASPGDPATIAQLTIDGCVLGPIRTRNGGEVETVTITDSMVQGLAGAGDPSGALAVADVYDPTLLVRSLASASPLSQSIVAVMDATAQAAVTSYTPGATVDASALQAVLDGLNALIAGAERLDAVAPFAQVPVDAGLAAVLAGGGGTGDGGGSDVALPSVNRALLQAAFPVALAPAALAFDDATVTLERVTVLGSAFVHRLAASDSIVTGFSVTQDAQDGCVRYSAVTVDSYTPRQYSCARITAGATLFTSSVFGHPAYAQLLEMVDSAIVSAATGVTISAGASNGSEMGAYSQGLAPVRERGLLIKYGEYMPLGLTPVIVHVT